MNHLKVVSIKPHLRRSRSHTSPSPNRPPIFSTDPSTAHESQPERNKTDPISTTRADNKSTAPDQRSPRASIDSQRHGRLSHLHLHSHLHGSHGNNGEDQNKKVPNKSSEGVRKLADSKAAPTDTSGQSSDNKSGASQIFDSFPLLNGQHSNISNDHEPWLTLSPSNQEHHHHHHHLGLRRSHSHRSTSQVNITKDDLLSPQISSSRQSLGLGASPTSPNRPRATSDSTRPAITRDLSGVSIDPSASSDAIALALEKGDRKREVKLLSATSDDITRLDCQATAAEEEMRRRLINIEHEGLEITRRLDYAYYSLLERVGDLSAVVSQLQGLRSQVLELGTKIETEMKSIDEEIRSNIATLRSNAEGDGLRSRRVESLERRMQAGRANAKALSDRLEAARSRLIGWEKRDQEWRNRIGRRLKACWIGILLILFIGFLFLGMNGLKQTNSTLEEMGLGERLGPNARAKSSDQEQKWIEQLRRESFDKYNLSTIDKNTPLGKRISEGAYIPDEVLRVLIPTSSSSVGSSAALDEERDGMDGSTTTPTPKYSSLSSVRKQERPEDAKGEGYYDHDEIVLRSFDEL